LVDAKQPLARPCLWNDAVANWRDGGIGAACHRKNSSGGTTKCVVPARIHCSTFRPRASHCLRLSADSGRVTWR
jgi:hypothetical protein